mgnify:CR=1 FL=1
MYRRIVNVLAFLGLALGVVGCMSLGPQVGPLGGQVALATGGNITVIFTDSKGNYIPGAEVYYYDSGWKLLGTTDGTGPMTWFLPKKTDVEIRPASGGKYKWVGVDPTTNPTLSISTVPVTVKLVASDGVTPLVGEALYYKDGWQSIGNTPATIELLPYTGLGPGQGNYDFRVKYGGRTSPIYTQDIAVNPVVVFKTTKVILFGSNVLYYNNGWQQFTSPMEMIGGVSNRYGDVSWCDFKFDGSRSPTVRLNITGDILCAGVIKLVDEAGRPLANYPSDFPAETRNLKYKYRYGGSWAPEMPFKTDANGQVLVTIDPIYASRWDGKLTVILNQTSKEQDVRSGNTTFQTARVNVNLKSCDGPITEVPGGTVAQGGGYWYTHGTTGPTGTVTFYTFPGSIKVRMQYNHASEERWVSIVSGVNNIDFLATKVTLRWGSDIKSNKGGSWWLFQKPSMYLLPGDYNFWFKNGGKWVGPIAISVSGCAIDKALLRVVDELGNGVAGGKATPAIGGSWCSTLPGTTDANGNLLVDWDSRWTKIKMTVNQGSEEKSIAALQASNYTWTTQILRIWLLDHAGNPITDGKGVLDQGGGYWYGWGNLNISGYRDIQLFPGTYKFRVTYNYTSETKDGIVVTAGPGIQNFYFQTGQVIGPCITEYSSGAWRTFISGMELMPGTYTFRYPSQSGTVKAGEITYLSCP